MLGIARRPRTEADGPEPVAQLDLRGSFPEADDEQVLATTGIAFSPGSSIVFDAAVVTGLSDDAPDFQILFGVTTNLGRLWTPSDD